MHWVFKQCIVVTLPATQFAVGLIVGLTEPSRKVTWLQFAPTLTNIDNAYRVKILVAHCVLRKKFGGRVPAVAHPPPGSAAHDHRTTIYSYFTWTHEHVGLFAITRVGFKRWGLGHCNSGLMGLSYTEIKIQYESPNLHFRVRLLHVNGTDKLYTHRKVKWLSQCVGFNVPLDTWVISGTSLSRQSIALVLTTKQQWEKH